MCTNLYFILWFSIVRWQIYIFKQDDSSSWMKWNWNQKSFSHILDFQQLNHNHFPSFSPFNLHYKTLEKNRFIQRGYPLWRHSEPFIRIIDCTTTVKIDSKLFHPCLEASGSNSPWREWGEHLSPWWKLMLTTWHTPHKKYLLWFHFINYSIVGSAIINLSWLWDKVKNNFVDILSYWFFLSFFSISILITSKERNIKGLFIHW